MDYMHLVARKRALNLITYSLTPSRIPDQYGIMNYIIIDVIL